MGRIYNKCSHLLEISTIFLLCVERKWKYLEYSNGEANDNLPLGIWEPWKIQCKESTKSPQEGKKSGRQAREVESTR